VLKANLRAVVKGINESLLSTLAACGDVNRNVVCSPTPAQSKAHAAVQEDCRRVALALAPRTPAYHAIWIDGVQLNLEDEANKNFTDPLYGKAYLPRKFKTAFAIPPVNDVDVFTNDQGYIAIIEGDQLVGYNLAVGGGMGRSHGNEATYPRLADVIGFLPRERVLDAAKAVLTIHRDFGDRTDRKHARLKYVVAERGVTANTPGSNTSWPSAAWTGRGRNSSDAPDSSSSRRVRSNSRRWATSTAGIAPWTARGS